MGFFKKVFRKIRKARVGRFLKRNVRSAGRDIKKARVGRFIKKWGPLAASIASTAVSFGAAAPVAAGVAAKTAAIKGVGFLGKAASFLGKGSKIGKAASFLRKGSKIGRLASKGFRVFNKFRSSKIGRRISSVRRHANRFKGFLGRFNKVRNNIGKQSFFGSSKRVKLAQRIINRTPAYRKAVSKIAPTSVRRNLAFTSSRTTSRKIPKSKAKNVTYIPKQKPSNTSNQFFDSIKNWIAKNKWFLPVLVLVSVGGLLMNKRK